MSLPDSRYLLDSWFAGHRHEPVTLLAIRRSEATEHIRQVAYEIVLRACGFASLGIFCVMIGMSFDPHLAFQAGGTLTLMMSAVLILKAFEARKKNYRHTEMWLYLSEEHRPPQASAQRISSMVLREVYLTFARWTALISIAMWIIALFFFFFETPSQLNSGR